MSTAKICVTYFSTLVTLISEQTLLHLRFDNKIATYLTVEWRRCK